MSIFLFIWYAAIVVAGIFRAIPFGLFAANLMAIMILALIFLG